MVYSIVTLLAQHKEGLSSAAISKTLGIKQSGAIKALNKLLMHGIITISFDGETIYKIRQKTY